MPVFYLPDDDFRIFPHPDRAEPSGLIAISRDLHEERTLMAYANGMFPWFEEDGHFFWFTPDPRLVLFPHELQIHKSMRSIFNQNKFRYTLDTAFEAVMSACAAAPRNESGPDNTWINEHFIATYKRLHQLGYAHSVEVWEGENLVGGLYGISIGKIFYGESMFAAAPNASKAGFITLVQALQYSGYWLIDCQVETPHLASLGARGISRELFYDYLMKNAYERTLTGKWRFADHGRGILLRRDEG
ncbi:MAG: leucyl/phenylalanyl-tRNA--protein transferase [Saprospiraceae bacterium]|nr:leucyl/phenylalanyl-tRNA--protein transferase [Saprospiraceae bacterium]